MRPRPILSALILGLLAPVPALAQNPGDPMASAGAPADPVGRCDRNRNLVEIMIPPDVHAIPIWVRPFTSRDETPPELLALWRECRAVLARAEPLVNWQGRGRGLRPMGDMGSVPREAEIQRQSLPDDTPTDRELRRGDLPPPARP